MRYLIFLLIIILIPLTYFYTPNFLLWSWFGRAPRANDLVLENESLKAQLAELKVKNEEIKVEDGRYLVAKIYSTYPFNDRHLFTIAAGTSEEVKELMPVLAKKNILLGQVTKVFSSYSEVKSIFSPDWQIPVKIGDSGVDGLFMGGPNPKVTMIVNDKTINVGDDVYSVSKDFPYGLKVGEVASVGSGGSFFKEVSLNLPYDFNNLASVLILRINNEKPR